MVSATFIGYQQTAKGDSIPLFNVTGGSRDKSTVTLASLKKLGIKVPRYPDTNSYNKLKGHVPQS